MISNVLFSLPGAATVKKTWLTYLFFLLFFGGNYAATRQAVASGNWNASSTWSGNIVPSCGDSIIIASGYTVNIDQNVNYSCGSKTALVVRGSISFSGGRKMYLPCNSRLYVYGGASIIPDGGGSSNLIDICDNTEWHADNGNLNGPACIPSSLPECSMVMPVELSRFEGAVCGENICINWSTMTERNNSFFVLQRMDSDRFVDLEIIRTAAPDGNSRRTLNYSTVSEDVNAGLNYFRLKQIDIDGTFTYSKIIAVDFNSTTTEVSVWPNPSNGDFNITVPQGAAVTIRNALGKTVCTYGSSQETVTVNGLGSGMYFCLITHNGATTVKRVVVK